MSDNRLCSGNVQKRTSPTATRHCMFQARRALLLERETTLQRWALKLDLESARQAAAAKTLHQQLSKVTSTCHQCVNVCSTVDAMLGSHRMWAQKTAPVCA